MAESARVKDYEKSLEFYTKIEYTNIENILNDKFTCSFCEKEFLPNRYHKTRSDLIFCGPCFAYMMTLPPFAGKTVERFLLGNVI